MLSGVPGWSHLPPSGEFEDTIKLFSQLDGVVILPSDKAIGGDMVEKPVMFVPAQEIGGLTYAPGQRWTHNCMECECLVSQRLS